MDALNRDLPYDQFIIEQIAGDLIPGATADQVVATGFLRNSMINEEGGIDPEQFRMEAMFDRMDCVGKAILGLTIQCAQCHDHKYDPLTQEEYYRMFAFLNNSHEANIAVYTQAERKKIAEIKQKTHEIEELIQHQDPDWPERMAAWEKLVSANRARVGGRAARGRRGIDRGPEIHPDGGWLVPGPGIRTDEAHRGTDGQDRDRADHGRAARVAQRRQPAAFRPGPFDQGNGAL